MTRLQKLNDWADEHLALTGGIGFAVILALIVAFIGLPNIQRLEEQKARFMEECLADGRQHYECVALWRGGSVDR